MSLLGKNQKEYFKTLLIPHHCPGSHNPEFEIRCRLGYVMKKLKDSHHNDDIVDELLKEMYDLLEVKYSFENFEKEYFLYLHLLVDRQYKIDKTQKKWYFWRLGQVPPLDRSKWNMWGSYKQFIFGKCVIDAINEKHNYTLHPVWGCLLSPTGGITGAGNFEIISRKWDSYISLHSCVHDASGYLKLYHDLENTGYNYLNTWMTLFPTTSPFSCQYAGLRYWKKLLKDINYDHDH